MKTLPHSSRKTRLATGTIVAVVAVTVVSLLALLLAFVLARQNTAPLLTIHVKSEPPVDLFTNAAPEVVRKYVSNAYQLLPLSLKSVTNITEADVEQLRNAVEGKSLWSAKCTGIEFYDESQALVIARTVLGGQQNYFFRKSDSSWKLIHQRNGRE